MVLISQSSVSGVPRPEEGRELGREVKVCWTEDDVGRVGRVERDASRWERWAVRVDRRGAKSAGLVGLDMA